MENDTGIVNMENELDVIKNELDEIENSIIAGAEERKKHPENNGSQELTDSEPEIVNISETYPDRENTAVDSGSGKASDKTGRASNREVLMKLDEIKRKLEVLDEIDTKLELLDEMDEQLNYIRNTLDTKLNVDFEAMYHNTLEQMNIEAIKVYRNIQAVIVEEDAKQNHVLFGVDGKSDKLKFRMNHVMIFSIISFVVSILVMVLQILPAFGIDIF